MFEDELEMEKKEGSGFGALFIIFALVAVVIGGIAWIVYQNQQTLKPDVASAAVSANLPGATTHFKTGHVVSSVSEKPDGPNYRLLQKAGLVKLGKAKGGAVDVTLTDAGSKLIDPLKDVVKKKDADGTTDYTVPLAQRKLVQLGEIKKISPSKFLVSYTWKWEPNELANTFDVQGKAVQSFSIYERSTLIDKFGVDYYHADPKKASIYVVKGDNGWKTATD
jgi:hypothetical protein